MGAAPQQAANAGSARVRGGGRPRGTAPRPRIRKARRPRPITIAIAALIALLSIGATLAVLAGAWPLAAEVKPPPATPTPNPVVLGLIVEKAGQPRKEGDQWIVPVKVTNQVKVSPQPTGTPAAGMPTPPPEPANVTYATINVLFYDSQGNVVGGGNGNVVDLPYGQSKVIEVVATGLEGDFVDYAVRPGVVWTDKDRPASPQGRALPGGPAADLIVLPVAAPAAPLPLPCG